MLQALTTQLKTELQTAEKEILAEKAEAEQSAQVVSDAPNNLTNQVDINSIHKLFKFLLLKDNSINDNVKEKLKVIYAILNPSSESTTIIQEYLNTLNAA